MKRFLFVAFLATPLFAISITPEVSTLGYGVSAGFGVTPLFGGRIAAHTSSYSRDLHKESIEYNGKLKLNKYGGLVDLYPFASGFRLSAGVFRQQQQNRPRFEARTYH